MARPTNGAQVFVSSPFFEYDPAALGTGNYKLLRFDVRADVASRLQRLGLKPWRWEEEGRRAKADNPKLSDAEIIEQAICDSALVLAIYQRRAGSFLPGYPFHATAFEIIEAIRHQKPIWLYVLGRERSSRLTYDIETLGDHLFLGTDVEFCNDSKDLLAAVEKRLRSFVPATPKSRGKPAISGIEPEEFSAKTCDQLTDRVRRLLESDEYGEANRLLEDVPVGVPVRSDNPQKRAFAHLLSVIGHVSANSLHFSRSVQAITTSAKIHAQLEDWFGFFARIQELSGVLNTQHNMRAWSVNSFGLQGVCRDTTRLGTLREAFYDSRASMLMSYGRLEFAEKRLRQNLNLQESRGSEPSPYSIAKLARILSYSHSQRKIDAAQSLITESALPSAIAAGHSTGYVLSAAAEIFIAAGDRDLASAFAAASIEYCLRKGYLLTCSKTLTLFPYIG